MQATYKIDISFLNSFPNEVCWWAHNNVIISNRYQYIHSRRKSTMDCNPIEFNVKRYENQKKSLKTYDQNVKRLYTTEQHLNRVATLPHDHNNTWNFG